MENSNVRYDLVGKVVAETGLTRATVVRILQGIEKLVFDQFKDNPEEFIIKEQKATLIIQHITYNKIEAAYDTTILTPKFIVLENILKRSARKMCSMMWWIAMKR